MPFKTNLERNNRIYNLWEEGRTVDEISTSMGIPRSSAGYYVRKFNQAARQGKTLPLPTKAKQDDVVQDFLAKIFVADRVLNFIKSNDPQKIYYYLASMKLLYELTPKLALTEEQKKILDSAIKDMGITASWSDQEGSAGVKKGKSLVELFPGHIKGKDMRTVAPGFHQEPSSGARKRKRLVDILPDRSE
jgi:hypothetical protein